MRNTGCPKNLLESGEQYIVVLSLSFVFPGCLRRLVINGARIFLFRSTINWQVDVDEQQLSISTRLT